MHPPDKPEMRIRSHIVQIDLHYEAQYYRHKSNKLRTRIDDDDEKKVIEVITKPREMMKALRDCGDGSGYINKSQPGFLAMVVTVVNSNFQQYYEKDMKI